MVTLIHFIHLLSLVMWMGSIIFFSFFAAPAVFRLLDRQKAGEVVGAIFPKYYGLGYICSVLAAATLMLSPRGIRPASHISYRHGGLYVLCRSGHQPAGTCIEATDAGATGKPRSPGTTVPIPAWMVGPAQRHRIDLRAGPVMDHCHALNVNPR